MRGRCCASRCPRRRAAVAAERVAERDGDLAGPRLSHMMPRSVPLTCQAGIGAVLRAGTGQLGHQRDPPTSGAPSARRPVRARRAGRPDPVPAAVPGTPRREPGSGWSRAADRSRCVGGRRICWIRSIAAGALPPGARLRSVRRIPARSPGAVRRGSGQRRLRHARGVRCGSRDLTTCTNFQGTARAVSGRAEPRSPDRGLGLLGGRIETYLPARGSPGRPGSAFPRAPRGAAASTRRAPAM